jgi:hypothetical protein
VFVRYGDVLPIKLKKTRYWQRLSKTRRRSGKIQGLTPIFSIYTDPSGYWWGGDLWNWFANWFQDTFTQTVTVDPPNTDDPYTLGQITVTAKKNDQAQAIQEWDPQFVGPTLPRINIERLYNSNKGTIGRFSIDGGKVKGWTVEPPKGTEEETLKEGSGKRIAAGQYVARPFNSAKFGKVVKLLDVKGTRTDVLIHSGGVLAESSDTTGCTVPGTALSQKEPGVEIWTLTGSPDAVKSIMDYTGRNAIITYTDEEFLGE